MSRDYTKYEFVDFQGNKSDNSGKGWGKSELVLELVKDYVNRNNSKLTFAELKIAFPDYLRDIRKVFIDLNEVKDYTRYFADNNQSIKLLDKTIAVSQGWGIDNGRNGQDEWEPFLNHCWQKLGIKTKAI